MSKQHIGTAKTLFIFIFTVLIGFILFILPNLFFGIFKINGGLSGINLLFIALFQFTTVTSLLYLSLKWLGKDFKFIGWNWKQWRNDGMLGIIIGLSWTAIQVLFIIPNTSGAERADIKQMLDMMDGTLLSTVSYIALGVIGGGITEEIYNRGYFINVLKSTFKNQKAGLWLSALLSVLFFALGHMPSNAIEWIDILVPTVLYTLLFIYTERLTASIFAHAIYNSTAILIVYYLYFG
ncbi:MAG: CPBP family intramembrane metalloprotease [Balneola sp.]|jgi:membrane protease YdiL (CAAX protease family)|nr:CPBP family intramembrane metalloprotease [Balneola sp.]MBE80282.1 CPBP family intramembrane metalloprotease [Balneola sp.]|tara:strand:- start:387 stop:1097 length:711 start_codon:yes stop_codon:yes gene_type:complete